MVGTTVSSGGNLTLAAGQDLTATAAYLNATQAISASAGGSVTLTSADQQPPYAQATAHTSHGQAHPADANNLTPVIQPPTSTF